jgi:hypothetical protein
MTRVRLFFLGYFLWGGIALVGRADEPAAGAADSPLASTRREIEALKNEQLAPSASSSLSLPNVVESPMIPPLLAPVTMAPRTKASAELATKEKSSNWLVEAMQKDKNPRTSSESPLDQGPARDRLGRAAGDGNSATELGAKDNLPGESVDPKDRDLTPDHRPKQNEEKPPENPLNRFMGEWLTPHDYELLKKSPGASSELQPSTFSSPGNEFLPDPLRQLPDGPSSPGDFAISPQLSAQSGAPGENPYLVQSPAFPQVLGGHPLDDTIFHNAPQGPAAPTTGRPTETFAPAPAPATNGPYVPDNLKTSDDAKYFPQLKRF